MTALCKVQLPGSFFENEGGGVNVSEIKILARVIGPVCASGSWQNYVSRNVLRSANLPNQDLVFKEKAPGWGLGAFADLSTMKVSRALRGLGLGADVLSLDREYEIPPRWTTKENGKTEFMVYISYVVPLISF